MSVKCTLNNNTLLGPVWSNVCILNYVIYSWFRLNKLSQMFLTDFGPKGYENITVSHDLVLRHP